MEHNYRMLFIKVRHLGPYRDRCACSLLKVQRCFPREDLGQEVGDNTQFQTREWKTFFVKDHIVNMPSFASSVVSVTALQFDRCSEDSVRENTNTKGHDHVPVKLIYKNRQWAGLGPQILFYEEPYIERYENLQGLVCCSQGYGDIFGMSGKIGFQDDGVQKVRKRTEPSFKGPRYISGLFCYGIFVFKNLVGDKKPSKGFKSDIIQLH